MYFRFGNEIENVCRINIQCFYVKCLCNFHHRKRKYRFSIKYIHTYLYCLTFVGVFRNALCTKLLDFFLIFKSVYYLITVKYSRTNIFIGKYGKNLFDRRPYLCRLHRRVNLHVHINAPIHGSAVVKRNGPPGVHHSPGGICLNMQ